MKAEAVLSRKHVARRAPEQVGPTPRCQQSAGRALPLTSAAGLRPELGLRRGLGHARPARLIPS